MNEMKKPVYTMDVTWARSHGEIDAWRESRRLNDLCADEIDASISSRFDGFHLPYEAVEDVLKRCGRERVEYVLASTVQIKIDDGRFSRRNKNWAMSFYIPVGTRSCFAKSHPTILNGFIDMVLKSGAETA